MITSWIYGYLRVTNDLDDHAIRRMERGLHLLAETTGCCFATTFHEYQPGYHGACDELTRELQRAQVDGCGWARRPALVALPMIILSRRSAGRPP